MNKKWVIMIEITRDNEDDGTFRFKAKIHVRKDIGVRDGIATEFGPWVSAFGNTPENAIISLYQKIGYLYILSLAETDLE